jgi:capsular polysaccharide transport system permease protein
VTAHQPPKISSVAAGPKPAPNPGPKPGPKPVPVRQPVRRAHRRWRHVLVFLSFLVCVALPGTGTAYYLYTVAADQYASKVGFTVRREDTNSALDFLGGLGNLSGASSTDTDILYEYIQSQKLVSEIDRDIDLRRIWSRPDFDPVFALPRDASIEELVDYWNAMVRLSYGAGEGLLEVEVRAFDPAEATLIAQTLFNKSSDMINNLSDIARQDAIRYARDELATALDRLKTARETITQFRNENQMINPEADLQSQAGLLSTLVNQQAETLIDIDLLRGTVSGTDPRLEQEIRRLAVIEKRIAAERQKLGFHGPAGSDRVMADIVGEYERLVVDREFAEQAYTSALAAYDAAQAEALRKSRYLAAYMEPTQAETAAYPKRLTLTGLITLFLFLIWSVAVLVAYSIKDRR